MITGTLRLQLRLEASSSLKDKRRPRQAILDRVRHDLKVAGAEVADHDRWDVLTLGFAAVGPERGPVSGALDSVVDLVIRMAVGELIADERRFSPWENGPSLRRVDGGR